MSGRMSGHNSPEMRRREQTLATRGASATAIFALETNRPGRLNEIGYAQRVAPTGKTGDRRSYAARYYDRDAAAAASSGYGC
jgi:hypothetical protein